MRSLISRAKSRFDAHTALGVSAWDDPNVAKRVQLTNTLAAAMGLICLPYTVVYSALGVYWLAALMPVVGSTGIIIPRLNRAGTARAFDLTRVIFFANFAASIALYSAVLGHGSMTHLAWFAGACLPFLLCDIRERGLIAFGALSQLGAYAFLELGGRDLLPPPVVDESVQYFLALSLVPTAFGMLLMMVGYFALASARAEAAMHGRNRDMRRVLDNVEQGFLTVDREGVVAAERSAVCDEWFERGAEGQTLWDYLASVAPEVAPYFELSWEEIWSDVMPLELVLEQLPQRIELDKRTLGLAYKPIERGGALDAMLVVLTDITPSIERARAEAQQRELMEVFARVLRDRGGFLDFMAEARRLVERLEALDEGERAESLRIVHTIKGNCGLFGVRSIAAACHELESRLAEEDRAPSRAERGEIVGAWEAFCARVGSFVGGAPRAALEVAPEEYAAMREAVAAGLPHAELAARLESWRHEPTASILARAGEQARALALRLGKGEIAVEIEHGGLRLDPARWSDFWSSFAHVVRNSVDHGLETPEQRAVAGKDPTGSIRLESALDGDTAVIRVADDGAGIDWSRVRDRARAAGLPHASHAALVDALCSDGLSTRDDVSELSGRGVGMAAVRAAVERLGGELRVDSVEGAGTTFTFRAPLKAPPGAQPALAA